MGRKFTHSQYELDRAPLQMHREKRKRVVCNSPKECSSFLQKANDCVNKYIDREWFVPVLRVGLFDNSALPPFLFLIIVGSLNGD